MISAALLLCALVALVAAIQFGGYLWDFARLKQWSTAGSAAFCTGLFGTVAVLIFKSILR